MQIFKWLGLLLALAAIAAVTIPAYGSTDPPKPLSWHENLSGPDASLINLTGTPEGLRVADLNLRMGLGTAPEGFVVTGERRLDTPVNRVRSTLTGTVPTGSEIAVEVRGHTADDRWTEWNEIDRSGTAALSAPVLGLQFRVTLAGDAAVVSALAVEASQDSGVQAAADGPSVQALTYPVFATREGLVGRTTANGRVITNRDHFVALPSRRGLNVEAGTRAYQVQVCYPRTGRCETAPVWDVGPWNTKDDYWNPSSSRQMWNNLPRGKPEAQAARLEGYNGGRDQFGRTVLNPAGIDLADGTFWDGLGMSNNDWVNVTFLWT